MGITFEPKASQISRLYSGRFAAPEEKEAQAPEEPADELDISQAGRDAAVQPEDDMGFDQLAEKVAAYLGSMTKEEFLAMAREQLGEPKQLEVNWNAAVDPDGSIWAKSYIDSLTSQLQEVAGVIRDHYADAYQEALDNPLGSSLTNRLNFIAAKYQCSWSDYFDASMPADQRQWTYDQVKRMLTGRRVVLNDPYALAGTGLNQGSSIDDIARKAASDNIQALIQQAKGAAGSDAKQEG